MTSLFFKRRTGAFLIAAVVLLPLSAVAQQSTPNAKQAGTLAAIAEAAYQHSPAIRAARQQLRGVQELYPQALAHYQPDIAATAGINDEDLDNSNFGTADGATTKDIGVTLVQPLWRGGRSDAQKSEASARIRAQKAALQATEQREMADAMQAGVATMAAVRTADVQRNTEALYQRLLGDTVKRITGGEATQTDRALAESRLSGVVAARMAADNKRSAAARALERQTGLSAAQWGLDAAMAELALPAMPKTVQEAQSLAQANSPDRAVLVAVEEAEKHGIDLVRGELLPELNARASWQKEWDPSPGLIDDATSRQVGLRLSIPLYEGGATRARVRQAKSRVAQSRYELEDFDLKLAQDVGDAWDRHETALARAGVLAAQGQSARTARDNIEQEVLGGEKTMTDLLQADQTWLDAQVQAIAAQESALDSTIELARLLGLLTPDQLGFAAAYDPDAYLAAVRHRVLSTEVPD